MQLKIRRSQKSSGMMSKAVVFCLDARLHLAPDEAENMKKYKLGELVIYNSETSKKHIAAGRDAMASGTLLGAAKSWAHLAAIKLSLNITLNKLVDGTHVECKDMDELLSAEAALRQAASTAKDYLDTAATFDGEEVVLDVA